MRSLAKDGGVDGFTDELLYLLLEEAERALILVESRADEAGQRLPAGDVPEGEVNTPDVGELRLAIAELADAHVRLSSDIESVAERLRNVGTRAATLQLESSPELLDLVRLSLEVFFRQHPSVEDFEVEHRRTREGDVDGLTAPEIYSAYQRISALLRARLS